MSLRPRPVAPVPEGTARVARAAFPQGNVYLRLRDDLGTVYTDDAFAPLFAVRGRPAEAPWRLALVLVLQFAEDLSDRAAADAVRSRLDWKYLLGLELTDPGFDASVLSEFRARLVAGDAALSLLDALLARCRAAGLLRARGRQRTDSTHVLAAIRVLNRLEGVGETLRHALNVLATVAPDWLRPRLAPVWETWAERYGTRFDAPRLPKDPAAREALAVAIGADGSRLLRAVYAPDAPDWLRAVPAVETLRRVWVQQYHAPETPAAPGAPGAPEAAAAPRWRASTDIPPAAQLIHSPHDPEARFSLKRETKWTGYKVHLTEVCDPDAPHLITHVETTPATTQDVERLAPIHAALAAKGLLPREHLVDTGYVDAEGLVRSEADDGVRVLGPAHPDHSWQARAGEGFGVAHFALDWDRRTATCPQGQTSVKWSPTHNTQGHAIINIRFPREACRACPSRAACTSSAAGPREITIQPRAQYEALQARRQHQTTPAFQAEYRARAGVEGTLAQGLRVSGLRRARYVGLAKTHLQHVLTAAALNVRRLGAWWDDRPFAPTRAAAFLALAPPA
jgi:transposase